MSFLQRTDSFDLDGKTYTIRALGFEASRKGYAIISKALGALADQDTSELNACILMASISGHLSNDDLKFLCDLFAPETSVDFNDPNPEKNQTSRVLKLSTKGAMDECFGGALEYMFDWLEKCVNLSYGPTIEKTRGAIEAVAARKSAPKAEPTTEE